MRTTTNRFATIVISILLLQTMLIGAESPPSSTPNKSSPTKTPRDVGLIFNTANILLELEGYQAGFGVKFGRDKLYLRPLLDLVVNGSSDSFALSAGATFEYHLFTGQVSPYIGGCVQAGYMRQGDLTSAIPFSIGAIAGAEVFIFDFLSIFAEYSLAADFTVTTDLQTSQSTFDYLIDTRMGNGSKIGIVIYFLRASTKK